MRRYLSIISTINLAIVAGIVFVFLYWNFWPDRVVVLTSPVTLDKHTYHWGDRITYTFDYCKTRKINGKLIRALVNSTRTIFTTMDTDLPVGCHKRIQSSDLVIPDYTSPGVYHLETTVEYKINPIRYYNVYWQSQEFYITK